MPALRRGTRYPADVEALVLGAGDADVVVDWRKCDEREHGVGDHGGEEAGAERAEVDLVECHCVWLPSVARDASCWMVSSGEVSMRSNMIRVRWPSAA